MNLKKIENILTLISEAIEKDVLNDKEYLVMIANLLFSYGKAGLISHDLYGDLNLEDAFRVELALNIDPDNIYLAAILQSHALLKWSEVFGDG